MVRTNNLTEGKVSKILLGFFFPMLFTNLLQQVYTFADAAIVGKGLGDNSLAAVGNMTSLTFFITGFSIGITNGFGVIIAQNYGSGNYEKLRKCIAASVKLAAIISVLLTIVGLVFLKPVMTAINTSEDIMDESLLYGYIIFGGLVTAVAYNMCSGILRALGDSTTPFKAIIVSSVVNVVLNCVFIFGFGTGVEGAAIATIISQLLSALICFERIRQIEIISLSREDFATDMQLNGALLKNGIPMACMNSVTAVGSMIVQSYVNALGVVYTSAYSVGIRYINLLMIPSLTAGLSMASFAGQNYGAGKYNRIKDGVRVSLAIALIAYIFVGTALLLVPEFLAKIMVSGDEAVALSVEFLRIVGVTFWIISIMFVFRNTVQGMGYPFIPMCSGVLEMIMRISTIVLLLPKIGFKATAVAESAAWSGALLLNLIAYIIHIRKKSNLTSE
ncbi:MAG: MATE family efflux transporter [Oscillospiraceae bacterium]|nr:MATE family efflux transporter [Oscillospiraceae bacterium]